jgi:hypothetical protein
MKETARRRITVTSSFNEISTDQLGNTLLKNKKANIFFRFSCIFTFLGGESPTSVVGIFFPSPTMYFV